MKVLELIILLKSADPEAIVFCEYSGQGGCDTCGLGSETEEEIQRVVDNETRVILSVL